MELLKKEDILFVNTTTVLRHGGNFVSPFNLLNPDRLDYLIDSISGQVFGQVLYPEIYQKAAVYFHGIISGHVFQDGNKRTGLAAALLFLRLNHYVLKPELVQLVTNECRIPESGNNSSEILFEFTMQTAQGNIDLKTVQAWFELNIEQENVQ